MNFSDKKQSGEIAHLKDSRGAKQEHPVGFHSDGVPRGTMTPPYRGASVTS